jgi:hypothetical protein
VPLFCHGHEVFQLAQFHGVTVLVNTGASITAADEWDARQLTCASDESVLPQFLDGMRGAF